jgi:hypothetical protein
MPRKKKIVFKLSSKRLIFPSFKKNNSSTENKTERGFLHWGSLFIFFFFMSGCQLISVKTEPTKKSSEDQTTTQKEAPKIGLFISGAGANTFSSLPLLELFQKEKIKFDFIAGTGWGAWIAAVYANNQSVDELKWNVFKLKEQGVFGTKWFKNKKKRVRILKNITKEVLSSRLNTPFVCPSLGKKGHLLWLTERKPAQAVFNCLNRVPPLFFLFGKTKGYGSLFSAHLTLQYLQSKNIHTIIWIKPSVSLKSNEQDMTFSTFWRELDIHLDTMQTQNFYREMKIIRLDISHALFSLYDFSELSAIMKSPVPLLSQEKVYRLKNQLRLQTYK